MKYIYIRFVVCDQIDKVNDPIVFEGYCDLHFLVQLNKRVFSRHSLFLVSLFSVSWQIYSNNFKVIVTTMFNLILHLR